MRVAGAASGGALSYGVSRAATGAGRVTWGGGGAALCLVAGCTGGRFGDAALALGATTLGGVRGSRKLAGGRYPVFRQLKAAAGLVTVIMTGRHDIKRVSIDDSVLSEDKEVLEDLLAAAVNDAVRKVEASNKDAMSGLASGLNLPAGFKLPF